MISVLVADDSFFMRKLISDILSSDPEIRVIGTASDGEQAVREAARLKPDVITMDLDMPKLDGMTATRSIMGNGNPHSVIIMVSAFTKEDADATFECLHAGAFDCIMKPSGTVSLTMGPAAATLIAKVKEAAHAKTNVLARTTNIRTVRKDDVSAKTFPLVIIGASTGGPPVLEELFSTLTDAPHAGVLIVQHMPEKFTQSLAERLDRLSCMKVKEAQDQEVIKPGVALIAPGDYHMTIEREGSVYRTRLTKGEPVHGMRPSIDVLMQSVSKVFTGSMLGILLTGMGKDGQRGMDTLKQCGARTIVQDPQTCVVDSMVQGVIAEHDADEILTPSHIAERLRTFSAA